jgi:hypothetical protein
MSSRKSSQCLGCVALAPARTREHAARDNPVTRDLLERECIELRRDFALKPAFVTLARMLARPAAIAVMGVADRLAARTTYGCATAWIVAGRSFLLRVPYALRRSRGGHARVALAACTHRNADACA